MSRTALCLVCALVLACGGEEPTPRPNLLLVSVDCLRADHLSCYGYPRPTSPTLDALAAEGVRFERAFSTTSWTLPAHLSMFTGLPVSAHGIDDDRHWGRTDDSGRPIPPPLRGTFLAEVLARAGYRTAGFYTWKYLDPGFGFGAGFEVWERLAHTFYSHPVVGPEFERLRRAGDTEGLKALAAAHPTLFDDIHPSSPEAVDRGIAWLTDQAARGEGDGAPFFLFLHLFDCHDPYHPPEPYASMFDPDYRGPIDGRRVTAPDSPVRGDMAPRDLEHLVALYDGAIRFVDGELARLLATLEDLDLARDTLVVVVGDHGEEFFEHGHKTHRRQLYMESVAVPLILRWPAGLPAGRVVEGNAGLVDLAATLCAAAGVSFPGPTMGVNLLPIARGEAPNAPRPYLSELVLFDGQAVPQRHLAIARGDQQRVVWTRGRQPWRGTSFDLAADPWGRGPGRPLEGEALATLEGELENLRQALRRLRDAQTVRGQDLGPLGELDLAELRALGYGGGEAGNGGGGADGADPGSDRLPLDGGLWPDR